MKNFIHDEERKSKQTTSFSLLTGSDTKLLDDLLQKIADSFAKNDKCKGFSSKLPKGCSITDDCVQITCDKNVAGKDIDLKIKVNRYVCLLCLRSQFSLQSCILRFTIAKMRVPQTNQSINR